MNDAVWLDDEIPSLECAVCGPDDGCEVCVCDCPVCDGFNLKVYCPTDRDMGE